MNKKILILGIIILLVASAFFVTSNPFEIIDGMNVQTQTQDYLYQTIWVGCPASKTYYESVVVKEILGTGGINGNGKSFGTSWYANGLSQSFSIPEGCVLLQGWYPGDEGPYFGRYYWKVEIVTESGGNILIMDKFGVKSGENGPLARVDSGYAGYHVYKDATKDNDQMNKWNGAGCNYPNNADWYKGLHGLLYNPYRSIQTLAPYGLDFVLYGHYAGKIVISLINERAAWSDECWGGGDVYCRNEQVVSYDEARLQSGWGCVELVSPRGGVAEGGETVEFAINTDYAGPDAKWRLTTTYKGVPEKIPGILRNVNGEVAWDSTYEGFLLPNDLTGASYYWDTPESCKNGEWGFKLYNLFTAVSFSPIYVVIQGAPRPTVTECFTEKDPWDYRVGETVVVTATGEGNPEGNNRADHFEIWIYLGDHINTLYRLYNPPDGTVTDLGNRKWSTTFSIPLDTVNIFNMDVRCWDRDPGEDGALPSDWFEIVVVGQDPDNPTESINVRLVNSVSGQPLVGLPIGITGQAEKLTNADGEAFFGFVEPGSYIVSFNEEGYTRDSKSITISGGEGIVLVTLKTIPIFNLIISILIPIIIIIISIVLAFVLPMWGYYRLIPIVIGIVLAIIFYLFLSGTIGLPLPV